MNLLGAKLYDPAVAVNKVTTALLAMTALDTTNLRIAFTIPAHGLVRVKLAGVLHGAATLPAILLGVMNGATVVGRVAPLGQGGATAVATGLVTVVADFVVSGLAPGAVSWDAAYGVETLVAATGLKYGGPNNTTANDAFGAFVFEVWDPQSQTTTGQLSVDANGRVDVSKVLGTAQTARDLGLQLDAAVSTRTKPADTQAAVTTVTNLTNAPTAGDLTAAMKTSVTTAATAATPTAAAVTGAVGSVTGLTASNLDVAVSTRLSTAGYTAPLDAAATRSAVGLASANLDTQLSVIAGYIDTEIASLITSLGAVKAKTDQLRFTVANQVDANGKSVNDRTVFGVGTEADFWHG